MAHAAQTPQDARGEAITLIPADWRRNAAQIAPTEVSISKDGNVFCHARRSL